MTDAWFTEWQGSPEAQAAYAALVAAEGAENIGTFDEVVEHMFWDMVANRKGEWD